MPRRNPRNNDAVFCVSISTYYSTKAEAKAELARLKRVAVSAQDQSTEYYEWDSKELYWQLNESYEASEKGAA